VNKHKGSSFKDYLLIELQDERLALEFLLAYIEEKDVTVIEIRDAAKLVRKALPKPKRKKKDS
jgi:hypothetical protein